MASVDPVSAEDLLTETMTEIQDLVEGTEEVSFVIRPAATVPKDT